MCYSQQGPKEEPHPKASSHEELCTEPLQGGPKRAWDLSLLKIEGIFTKYDMPGMYYTSSDTKRRAESLPPREYPPVGPPDPLGPLQILCFGQKVRLSIGFYE